MKVLLLRFFSRSETDNDPIHAIALVTQCFVLIKAMSPVVQWLCSFAVSLLHRHDFMSTEQYIMVSHNCKLRSVMYATTDGIIDMIQCEPGGYAFFGLLPRKGKGNKQALRKKVANYLISTLFAQSFLYMLLQASMTPEGRPLHHSHLYQWLLDSVYAGKTQHLYSDWLKYCKPPTLT